MGKKQKKYTVEFVLTIDGETVAKVQDSGNSFEKVIINVKDYMKLFDESEKT